MEVIAQEKGRIDKYLSQETTYSRSLIQKMIDNNYIKVNNHNIKSNYILNINDIINIDESYQEETNIKEEDIKLDIIYEDDYLMVINKPSGMVVHPGNGNKEHTLVNALVHYTNNLSDNNGENRLGIVHRIDKDTSGLLLVAKTNKAHELLADGFKNKTIKREYLALVNGVLSVDKGTIDAPIGRDTKDRKKMTVISQNSKQAVTHFEVLQRYQGYTLLKLKLDTGRTHQIRVHLKYIGYPVYNDPVYSNNKCTNFGQFLHSYSVDFIHPITNEHLFFKVEPPKEFTDYINNLANL